MILIITISVPEVVLREDVAVHAREDHGPLEGGPLVVGCPVPGAVADDHDDGQVDEVLQHVLDDRLHLHLLGLFRADGLVEERLVGLLESLGAQPLPGLHLGPGLGLGLLVPVDGGHDLVRLLVVVVKVGALAAGGDDEGDEQDLDRLVDEHGGEEGDDEGDHPLVRLVVSEGEGVEHDEAGPRDDVDEAEDPRDEEPDARPGLVALLLLVGDVALVRVLVWLEEALVRGLKNL